MLLLDPVTQHVVNVIYQLEQLREHYYVRLALIKEGFSFKSEFEKNEVEIRIIETNQRISDVTKGLDQNINGFEEAFENCISLCENLKV